jgi:tetratricopeptide (TPR) repeat protein
VGTLRVWIFSAIWMASGLDPVAVVNRHFSAGRPQLALYLIDRLVTPETSTAPLEALRARILMKIGQSDEALKTVAAGLKRWPLDPNLASLEKEFTTKEPAHSAPAVQPSPVAVGLEIARGQLLFKEQKYAEAAEHLQRAFDADARNFPLFSMLVQALYQQAGVDLALGKRDQALNYYDRAFTLESTYASQPAFDELQASLAPESLAVKLGRPLWKRTK